MKTVIEVEFQTATQAGQAAKIVSETKTDGETRAKVNATSKGKMLTATIIAADFTALRALTTTAMRDLKVIVDTFKSLVKKVAEFTVRSTKKIQATDITEQIKKIIVEKTKEKRGVIHVFVPHCTAAVFINEFEPNICADYEKLAKLLQREKWQHDKVDDNAYAHLASALLGTDVSVPVENEKMLLGMWQRIILMELDGPRERKVYCNFTSSV